MEVTVLLCMFLVIVHTRQDMVIMKQVSEPDKLLVDILRQNLIINNLDYEDVSTNATTATPALNTAAPSFTARNGQAAFFEHPTSTNPLFNPYHDDKLDNPMKDVFYNDPVQDALYNPYHSMNKPLYRPGYSTFQHGMRFANPPDLNLKKIVRQEQNYEEITPLSLSPAPVEAISQLGALSILHSNPIPARLTPASSVNQHVYQASQQRKRQPAFQQSSNLPIWTDPPKLQSRKIRQNRFVEKQRKFENGDAKRTTSLATMERKKIQRLIPNKLLSDREKLYSEEHLKKKGSEEHRPQYGPLGWKEEPDFSRNDNQKKKEWKPETLENEEAADLEGMLFEVMERAQRRPSNRNVDFSYYENGPFRRSANHLRWKYSHGVI